MQLMHSRIQQLLLLLLAACGTKAELLTPIGNAEPNENGAAFTMGIPFRVFNEDIPADRSSFFTRTTGRIVIGASAVSDYDIYNPSVAPPYHLIQPLEFTLVPIKGLISVEALYHLQVAGDQLTNLTSIVKENFWNMEDFTAQAGFLFTWEKQSSTLDVTKVNTFQTAILADGSRTFVIYNYHAVNYTQNPVTDQSVFAGFARGNTLETANLLFRGSELPKLATVSGVGSRRSGMHVYRIDTWPPVRGGCVSEDPTSPSDRVLSSTVTRESVLGGAVAVVSGACHSGGAGDMGTCTVTVNGRQVGQSPARSCPRCGGAFLTCQLPPALREGKGQLSLTLAGSANAYTQEVHFTNPDEQLGQRITLTNVEHWHMLNPQALQLTYSPSGLNGTVNLQIIGYTEHGLNDLDSEASRAILTKVLHTQTIESASTGQLNLRSPAVHCQVADDCEKYHLGYLQIVDDSEPMNVIRSNIIPLGWFVNKHYTDAGSPNWSTSKCSEWSAMSDATTTAARNQLKQLTCPCTLQQAMGDVSRYLPTADCSLIGAKCTEAVPKQQCFVSRVTNGAEVQAAAAAMCCYDSTKNHLLYQELKDNTNSKKHGSTSFRSHPDGYPAAGNLLPGQAAFMSHWYWDNMRHMYCCKWSSTGTCPYYYMQQRPTPSCANYKLGRSSSSVGDPHITGFGWTKYLFNSFGEYWLLASDAFKVQGRYEAPMDAGNYKNYTLMTGVAFSASGGAAYEVKFADGKPQVRRREGAMQPVTVQLTQDVIYRDAGVALLLKSEQNLMVQLSNGSDSVGIDLYGFSNSVNLLLSMSETMKDKTRGLYGRWSDTAASEFVAADGVTVPFNSNAQQWDAAFCNKNRLSAETDSLFNYEPTRQVGFNEINVSNRAKYTAIFDHSGMPPNAQESICGSDEDCKFDLRVSGDVALARATMSADEKFASIKVTANTTLAFCDKPAIIGIAISEADTLAEGSSLELKCAASLTISRGGVRVTCQRQTDDSYTWMPAISDVQCSLTNGGGGGVNQANIGLIIGIVLGCVAAIVLIIVIVVLVMRNRREPSRGPGEKYMEDATMPMRPPPSAQRPANSSSRDVIIGGGAGAGGGKVGVNGDAELGMDNQGHLQQQQQQQMPYHQDPRYSYQESQQQPIQAGELNYTDYAEVNKGRQQPLQPPMQQQQLPQSHSEVV